ncbi:phosphopantetheine-binding protein [Micromonospora sp. NPDC048999]|uniref:phosphopantetheine-binding protein n=1 Tax=Micromonospora sp. NPDC048999 TaxID=3155391 RepID=UPI0033D202AC
MDTKTRPDTKTRIRTFLGTRWPGDLRDDDDIFETGLVNSLFAMQLVLFVEQEFAIELDNGDLERDNFRTVNAIAELVERHAD